MKNCSASLTIRMMHIKTTKNCHYIPIGVAKIITIVRISSLARVWSNWSCPTLLVGLRECTATLEKIGRFL